MQISQVYYIIETKTSWLKSYFQNVLQPEIQFQCDGVEIKTDVVCVPFLQFQGF